MIQIFVNGQQQEMFANGGISTLQSMEIVFLPKIMCQLFPKDIHFPADEKGLQARMFVTSGTQGRGEIAVFPFLPVVWWSSSSSNFLPFNL